MGDVLLVLFFVGLICGIVGATIAQHKGGSAAAGFFLGAFLGPIGLIIAALLGPEQQVQAERPKVSASFEGERSLANDSYKLWLTSRFNIQRNDVLGSYVCDSRLFPTLDAVLAYASDKHASELAAAEQRQALLAQRQKEWDAAEQRRLEASRQFWRRWKSTAIAAGLGAFALICFGLYEAVQANERSAAIERQKVAAAKRRQDAMRASANAALRPYGLAIGAKGFDAETDVKAVACTYVTSVKNSIKGVSAHFDIQSEFASDGRSEVILLQPDDWNDVSNTLDSLSDLEGQSSLFINKVTGAALSVLAAASDHPDSGGNAVVHVNLCVGKPKSEAETKSIVSQDTPTDDVVSSDTEPGEDEDGFEPMVDENGNPIPNTEPTPDETDPG